MAVAEAALMALVEPDRQGRRTRRPTPSVKANSPPISMSRRGRGTSPLATCKFALDLLDPMGKADLEGLGQRLRELVLRDAERARGVAQRVLGHNLVLRLAQQKADGRCVGMLDLGINGGHAEAELADVLGLELPGPCLDDEVGPKLEVTEERVDVEVVPLPPPSAPGARRRRTRLRV